MPIYSYLAKNLSGEIRKGKINAQNIREVARILKEEDLILIKAVEEKEKKGVFKFFFSGPKISLREKVIMTRNLYIMTATGLSLSRIFNLLSLQAKNKKIQRVLEEIKERIGEGEALSQALSRYPGLFSELFVSMVKVGEESGTLEEVFKTLSLQLEKEHHLRSKVQGAMIYPVIILLAMLIAGGVIISVVIPQLNTFFSSINVELPFYTKLILKVGNFIHLYWSFFVLSFLVFIFLMALFIRTPRGRRLFQIILFKLPFFSSLVKENESAILIRALSSLLSSGVSLVRSLEVILTLTNNYFYQKAIQEAIEGVKRGSNFSATLKAHEKIFPLGVIEMLEVGEETGKTSLVLRKLADFYEEEVIAKTEKLSTVLEPLLIVILALAVGIFAFSVIQPMYSVLNLIGE